MFLGSVDGYTHNPTVADSDHAVTTEVPDRSKDVLVDAVATRGLLSPYPYARPGFIGRLGNEVSEVPAGEPFPGPVPHGLWRRA